MEAVMHDAMNLYLLARLLAGAPTTTIEIAEMDGLRDVAQAIIQAGEDNRLHAFEAAIAGRPDASELRRAVMAADPSSPPLKPQPLDKLWEDVNIMPPLSDLARLPDKVEASASSAGSWLNTYVDYAIQRAPMLPALFHESAGLWLLSLAIARRLKVAMPHGDIYPNLFLLWVAPTTVYTKSTGLTVAREIAEDAVPHLLLSSEFSPEGLLDDMSGKPPANLNELPESQRNAWNQSQKYSSRRGLVLDEASSLFANLKRDHNIGLSEALMRFYDCSNHSGRTRGRGLVVVKDSYMSFIGATTEISLRQADVNTLWQSGLWPRFGLIVPTEPPAYKRCIAVPSRPEELVEHLKKVAENHLPVPNSLDDFPDARCMLLGPGVFDAWQHYDQCIYQILLSDTPPAQPLFGIYGRLPTHALKIAACLAVADWDGSNNTPTIDVCHWARAQKIAETWRAGAHQLYYTLTGIVEEDSLERRILSRIAKLGEKGLTIREIYRAERSKREAIEPVVRRLAQEGLLESFRPEGGKTEYFRCQGYDS
jgi:hypothetical protein